MLPLNESFSYAICLQTTFWTLTFFRSQAQGGSSPHCSGDHAQQKAWWPSFSIMSRSSLKQDLIWQQRNYTGHCRDLDFIIRETWNVATRCSHQVKAGWSLADWPKVVRVITHTITQTQAVLPPTTFPTKTEKDIKFASNFKSRFFSWIFQRIWYNILTISTKLDHTDTFTVCCFSSLRLWYSPYQNSAARKGLERSFLLEEADDFGLETLTNFWWDTIQSRCFFPFNIKYSFGNFSRCSNFF